MEIHDSGIIGLEIVIAFSCASVRIFITVEIPTYDKRYDVIMHQETVILVHDDGLFVFATAVSPIQERCCRIGNDRNAYLFTGFVLVVVSLRREFIFAPRCAFTFFFDVQGIKGLKCECCGYFGIFFDRESIGIFGRDDFSVLVFPCFESVAVVVGGRDGYFITFLIISREWSRTTTVLW